MTRKRKNADSPRLAALRMLASVLDSGSNLTDAEQANRQADGRDRAFARHLAYGTLRWLSALDWLAGQLLRKPLRRKDRDVHRLILIGLFELWKDADAAHATINECAESGRKLGKSWSVSVINAVLRRFQRERANWMDRLEKTGEDLAHPAWLLRTFRADWPEHWKSIAVANNQPGSLWLRLNRRFDVNETLEGLRQAGFQTSRHEIAKDAVMIRPAAAVTELPGFEAGRISVQDPAAQLAAGLLNAEKHHQVLDACAAPGGKTCHILEALPGVNVTAIDRSEQRLERLRENLSRLGLPQDGPVRLVCADAAEPDTWWNGNRFDRILLDAPCTATGTIRRHPEIKWLRNPKQLQEASALQARLLKRLWPLLKPGGILLYATCSVLRDENDRQIERFLQLHPEAESLEISLGAGRNFGTGRQILPGEQDMDGFYYARLCKNS